MRQNPIGTTRKQSWRFAWPRDLPELAPDAARLKEGQVAVNRNYVDTAIAALGGGAPGLPPTPHVDAGIGLSKDTTVVPNVINLEPAQVLPGEIGGINEAPSDGQAYARQNVGWTPVDPGTPFEDGVGITIDTSVVPNVINLDPATETEIGGITEPPDDGLDYARTYDATAVPPAYVWVESTGQQYNFARGLEFDEATRDVNLDPAGPTNLGGVIVPPRDATTQALSIDMGNEALGDPATGELRAPPATDTLLGALTEPPQDGLSYARRYDAALVPPAWAWEPTVAAGLQITSVIPDKCLIDAAAPDITVNAYGSEFTPTCVIMIDGVPAPTQPDTESHLTFTVDPGLHPQYHAAVITVEDPAVPEVGSGGEQFEFILQATDVLSLTFINPNEAVWGPGIAPVTVEAHGSQFTPTTVVLWDGVAVPTVQISNTELHFTVDPTIETTARTAVVTVADGAVGLFDASFYFRDARVAGETADHTGVVFIPPDRGLSYSPTTGELSLMPANAQEIGGIREPDDPAGQATWVRTGDMRWVPAPLPGQIAGNAPDEIGIVFVPERTQGQGLTLEDDGGLYLRIATDQHLGGILEPAETDKQFVRVRDGTTGLGEWVETTAFEEPPMSPVALWARSSGGARGWLEIPETPPGGMDEPPANPVAIWGRSSAGVRGWLEVPTFDHLTGFVEKIGDTMQGFLTLHDDPVNPFHAATRNWVELEIQLKVDEPPNDDVAYARKWKEWVKVEDAQGMEEPPAEPVALWSRSSAGARGWLEAPTFEHLDGKVDKFGDTMTGDLTLAGPPTHPLHAASKDYVDLSEPQEAPHNGKAYARQDGQWVEVEEAQGGIGEPPANPVAVWGRTSDRGWAEVPTFDHLTGFVDKIGDTMTGALNLRDDKGGLFIPNQPAHAINLDFAELTYLKDAPTDGKQYVREEGKWVEAAPSDSGIEEPPMNPVAVWGRTPDRGWTPVPTFDDIDGFVSKIGDTMTGRLILAGNPDYPLEAATKDYVDLNVMPEAPVDGRLYARQSQLWEAFEPGIEDVPSAATATYGRTGRGWVEITGAGGLPIDAALYVRVAGDTMQGTLTLAHEGALAMEAVTVSQLETLRDEIKPLVPVGRSPTNGLEHGYDDVLKAQTIWVPLATDTLAGAIVEPPADGAQYVRINDTNGPAWVENIAKGVHTDDAPPMTPSDGALWWKSSTGALYVFYEDIDSGQWVQVNGTPSPDATISTGDTPPSNPRPNQLYFESDTGSLFFWYNDGDSSQWIEILGGSGGTAGGTGGIAEAPIDGNPYNRQDGGWVIDTAATTAYVDNAVANAVIDAQAFVRAASTGAEGHDTDLCAQALAAVEKMAISITQLQAGHQALKARIKALEARR